MKDNEYLNLVLADGRSTRIIRQGDLLFIPKIASPKTLNEILSRLGLTQIPGSLKTYSSFYVSLQILEWSSEIALPENVVTKLVDCPHQWETRLLFTSRYSVCKLCGKEESNG
jgi:hypothetical protein